MKVEFVKTHPDAKLPTRNNKCPNTGDTGYDIYCIEDVYIPARGSAIAPVGITLGYITPNYWMRIEPRSGLGFKHNIQPHLGVLDNGYRGDLGVKLYNFGDKDVHIEKGKAIAQLVVYDLITAEMGWREDVTSTDRGEKGFGSSDLK